MTNNNNNSHSHALHLSQRCCRYQSLSHSLWARQQQQRAHIDREISRVIGEPQSATQPPRGAREQSNVELAPECSLSPRSSKPLAPVANAEAGMSTVQVRVKFRRGRHSDAAAVAVASYASQLRPGAAQ
jgi:hypothetical protein